MRRDLSTPAHPFPRKGNSFRLVAAPVGGAALQIDKLDISPLEYDFIEFTISGALTQKDMRMLVPMAVGWK